MRLSVILPTYNRAHLISTAVTSVLDHLGENDELIIIDDGSTDRTDELIAKKYQTERVRYIKTENQGAGAARNLGLCEAKGRLIGFVDSDNYWLPGKLDVQIGIMAERKDLVCCFTDFTTTKSDGKTYHRGIDFWKRQGPSWVESLQNEKPLDDVVENHLFGTGHTIHYGSIYSALLGGNYIPVWTSIIRKSLLKSNDLFASDVKTYEEWEFFGKISRNGDIAFVDIETAHNMAHGGPRLTDINYINRIESELKIMGRVWGRDKAFLEKEGTKYNTVLSQKSIILINHYLKEGATENLMQLLSECPMLPMRYQLIKKIPVKLLSGLRHFF